MIRLLAIDIDGTLLDSHGRIPDAHRHALDEASARGVAIVLATGRSFHFTRPIAEALNLARTLIVNNGALVKDAGGATLLRYVLPRDTARQVLTETRAFEESVALVFDRLGAPPDPAGAASPGSPEIPGDDAERKIVYERMDWTHPNRRGYYEKNKAFIAAASPLADALTEDPIQVMFNGDVESMRALVEELGRTSIATRFSVAVTEYTHRDFSMVDVNAAGCSKATTLARWASGEGFARDEIMAVGDNLSDIEMLKFAATPVVMGNAPDVMKSTRPFHVTGSNDEGGLADAIKRFILTNR